MTGLFLLLSFFFLPNSIVKWILLNWCLKMTWQMHDMHDTQWCNVKMCTSCSFLLDSRFIKQERCQCRGDSAQGVGSREDKKTIKIDFKNICYGGTYSGSMRMFLVVASWVDPVPQDNSCCKSPQLVSAQSPTQSMAALGSGCVAQGCPVRS